MCMYTCVPGKSLHERYIHTCKYAHISLRPETGTQILIN